MKLFPLLPAIGLVLASTTACSQEVHAPSSGYVCPVKNVPPQKVTQEMGYAVLDALNKAFDAALGPDAKHVDQPKVVARLAATRVGDAKMAALAEISGCAALIDVDSSCSLYYDPEQGDPLSVFMRMKRSAPLRKQFEDAVAHVPDLEQRRAAQSCIKLVGGTR
jgi:hypothetical protein